MRPKVVCLCGSTRFEEAFAEANLRETLAGNIVLSIGCNMKSDDALFAEKSEAERQEIKRRLDELHKRKIDLADEILVLNVGRYIGESTASEIEYARKNDKMIRFLEPKKHFRFQRNAISTYCNFKDAANQDCLVTVETLAPEHIHNKFWIGFAIPNADGVVLNQEMAKQLAPLLVKFGETGDI